MSKYENRSTVQELSASQHGLFTTAQAEKNGVSRQSLRSMERSGFIRRLMQGVYKSESVPDSVLDTLRAIWMTTAPEKMTFERLAEGDGVVIGGRTAASLLGLGEFYLSPYTFFVPKRYQSRNSTAVFKKRIVDIRDVITVQGLPVTNISRTLFDLKCDSEDPSLLAQATVDAIHRPDDFDYERLCELFAHRASLSGNRNMDDLPDLFTDAGITLLHTIETGPETAQTSTSTSLQVIQRSDGRLVPIDPALLEKLSGLEA
jgi:predicted transcriptional regulator of viral defense system